MSICSKIFLEVTVFKTFHEDYFSNYWLSCILVEPQLTNGIDRETLRLALESQNIESRPLWKPIICNPFSRNILIMGIKWLKICLKKGYVCHQVQLD